MKDDVMICPKTRDLVDSESCIALKNLTRVSAGFFARKVCLAVQGCPKEEYCAVFECGWTAAGELLETTMKD